MITWPNWTQTEITWLQSESCDLDWNHVTYIWSKISRQLQIPSIWCLENLEIWTYRWNTVKYTKIDSYHPSDAENLEIWTYRWNTVNTPRLLIPSIWCLENLEIWTYSWNTVKYTKIDSFHPSDAWRFCKFGHLCWDTVKYIKWMALSTISLCKIDSELDITNYCITWRIKQICVYQLYDSRIPPSISIIINL